MDRAQRSLDRAQPPDVTEHSALVDRLGDRLSHLADSDVHALAVIVERLVQAYQPERIYLFGSKARGDSGPDSDFDLLLVVSDDAPPERRGSDLAYHALKGTGFVADVPVCTHSYFEARRHLRASFPGTVLREGRLLYAA